MKNKIHDFNTTALDRRYWINRNSHYYRDLEKFYAFHLEKSARVLEIGFGVGKILSACTPRQGFGLDLTTETAEEAKILFPQYQFDYWNGDSALPGSVLNHFKEGVDYIILINTFGYWSDVQKSLELLKPLIRPHTRIITNYYNFLWAPLFKIMQGIKLKMPQPDLNWLSKEDVSNFFKISGYRPIKTGFRFIFPFNIKFLSDFINRWVSPIPIINKLCVSHFVIARLPATKIAENIKVSVVIPARNEQGNIEPAVRRILEVTRHRKERYEVIFVEGNSTDKTWDEINRVTQSSIIGNAYEVQVMKQPGKGKGDAVRCGFAKATGDLLMILDADLTVIPEDLPKFVDVYLNGHGEFINGCRLIYAMEKEAMRPLNLLGNKFFSIAFSYLLSQKFKDTLCGTKVLTRENYNRISKGRVYFGDFDPFGDFDLIFGASKLDLEITEVPIRYRERTYGETNISRFRHGLLLLRMCIFALGRIKFVR